MIPLLLIGCSKDGDVNVETESTNILENSDVEDITSVVISTYEGCRIVCADECWEDGLEIYKKIMSMDTHAHS